ncbi:hypothetical protein AB0N56_34570 [Streptomyces microflavus]
MGDDHDLDVVLVDDPPWICGAHKLAFDAVSGQDPEIAGDPL